MASIWDLSGQAVMRGAPRRRLWPAHVREQWVRSVRLGHVLGVLLVVVPVALAMGLLACGGPVRVAISLVLVPHVCSGAAVVVTFRSSRRSTTPPAGPDPTR